MVGYEGDRSYQRLFANIYGMNKTNNTLTQNYNEQNIAVRPDDTLIQSALSFVRSGYLGNNNDGAPHTRNSYGNFWENVIRTNTIGIYYLNFLSIRLNTQHIGNKGNGYSVRCVTKSFFLKKISPLFSSQSFLLPVIFTTRFVRKVSNRDA